MACYEMMRDKAENKLYCLTAVTFNSNTVQFFILYFGMRLLLSFYEWFGAQRHQVASNLYVKFAKIFKNLDFQSGKGRGEQLVSSENL